jgi:thiol-disulfide isomerase/thioredoxin
LIVCVAVLAAACAFGLIWRRRNGVLRAQPEAAQPRTAQPRTAQRETAQPPTAQSPAVQSPTVQSQMEKSPMQQSPAEQPPAGALTPADLGEPLGSRATLVQFSSAFCAPCRATRRILSDVAEMVDGVTHVEIDAEAHLDLVRELGIRRTPTVLVLGRRGEIIRRGSGQPRKADVIAALGDAEGVAQR